MIVNDLNALSFTKAAELLTEEGYLAQPCIETQEEETIRKFTYPYGLYKSDQLIDCIQYIEYCVETIDDEYTDERLTWEPVKY